MRILGNVINVSRPDLECALTVLDSRSVERRELTFSRVLNARTMITCNPEAITPILG